MSDSKLLNAVIKWRFRAVQKIKSMPEGIERDRLARKYYEADQSGLSIGKSKKNWPEMEPFLVSRSQREEREKRERLIKVKSVCGKQTYYKEAWLPTLEELRKVHPFDPEDDLKKPYRNKDLRK